MDTFIGKVTILETRDGVSRMGNPWRKVDALIETGQGDRVGHVKVTGLNERADDLEKMAKSGGLYKISVYVSAQQWQGKWYNDVKLAGAEPFGQEPTAPTQAPTGRPAPVVEQNELFRQAVASVSQSAMKDSDEDLPF